LLEGVKDGVKEGVEDGEKLGAFEVVKGVEVGAVELPWGELEGLDEGAHDGLPVGAEIGDIVVGFFEGQEVGTSVGFTVGLQVGITIGLVVGLSFGDSVVGLADGIEVEGDVDNVFVISNNEPNAIPCTSISKRSRFMNSAGNSTNTMSPLVNASKVAGSCIGPNPLNEAI